VRLTAPRLSHLAHQVLDRLAGDGLIDFDSRADALQALKAALEQLVAAEDAVDELVRDKLRKQKKIPGSREWQILYDKYLQEERGKRSW